MFFEVIDWFYKASMVFFKCFWSKNGFKMGFCVIKKEPCFFDYTSCLILKLTNNALSF